MTYTTLITLKFGGGWINMCVAPTRITDKYMYKRFCSEWY